MRKIAVILYIVLIGVIGFTSSTAGAESVQRHCTSGQLIYLGSVQADASFPNWGEGTISSPEVSLIDSHPDRINQNQTGERILVQLYNGNDPVAQSSISGDAVPDNAETGRFNGTLTWDRNNVPGVTQMNVVHQPDFGNPTADSVNYEVCVNFTPAPPPTVPPTTEPPVEPPPVTEPPVVVEPPVCDDDPETPEPEEGCEEEVPPVPPTEPPVPPTEPPPPVTEPPVVVEPPATTTPPATVEGPPELAHTGAETPFIAAFGLVLVLLGVAAKRAGKELAAEY